MAKQIVIPLSLQMVLMLCSTEVFCGGSSTGQGTTACAHSNGSLGYWNNISFLPAAVREVANHTVYGQYQNISVTEFILQPATLFIGHDRTSLTLEYFLEHYKRSEWLFVYCRSCRSIFQLYQL